VTVIDSVNISISQLGTQYIPSLKKFQTRRPFSEDLLQGFYYEVYGYSYEGGVKFIDPGLIGVGHGFFIKIGATNPLQLKAMDRALYITELMLNRFFGFTVDLTKGLTYFNPDDSGIVYILPHGVSSSYWNRTYGDRIYFYAYSNITQYKEYILSDLDTISEKYKFVILILPLEDTDMFYHNLKKMDAWATEKKIKILYSFFPKDKYEPEEYYLQVGSSTYNLTTYNMKFLSNLTSTLATSIWYGWEHRSVNVNEIENFYNSLPEQLKPKYYVWIDEPFLERVIDAGLTELTNRLNLTVVTEIYSSINLALYGFNFKHQIVVTGYWNAKTSDKWLILMKMKLNYVFTENNQFQYRKLGVWIFWDENDGCTEKYRAYINNTLCNPLLINLPPTASFSYSPNEITIIDSVNFYDLSEDLDGTIVSWHWNFGNGHISTNMVPTHNYSDKGSYTVTLTISDNDGYSDSTTEVVKVINLPPIVEFTFSPSKPKKEEDIKFIDGSIDPEEKTLQYSWDFGDGINSIQKNPTHRYEKAGTYSVKMSVIDDEGKYDTIVKEIEIRVLTYNLTVEVRDLFGFPVSNTEVGLYSNEHDCFASGSTDTMGKFTLLEIPEGEYQIKVTNFGYTTSKTVSLSTPKTEQVRVILSIYTVGIGGGVIVLIIVVITSLMLRKRKDYIPHINDKLQLQFFYCIFEFHSK